MALLILKETVMLLEVVLEKAKAYSSLFSSLQKLVDLINVLKQQHNL